MTADKVTPATGCRLQPLKKPEAIEGELLPRAVPPLPSRPFPPFAELERQPVAGGDILRDVFADFGRIFGGEVKP